MDILQKVINWLFEAEKEIPEWISIGLQIAENEINVKPVRRIRPFKHGRQKGEFRVPQQKNAISKKAIRIIEEETRRRKFRINKLNKRLKDEIFIPVDIPNAMDAKLKIRKSRSVIRDLSKRVKVTQVKAKDLAKVKGTYTFLNDLSSYATIILNLTS